MATWLKQSTAAEIVIGPFVDATDGVTAETALTIAQADIRLKKGDAAFAQTNNATGATHLENGHYEVPLDTTDTATLGRLRVAVNESGALPVWADFMVVPANVWDSMFGADALQVDVAQWLGTAPATPTTAGVPEVDVTHVAGAAQDIATATALATVDTVVDSILVDTAEIGAAGAGLTEAGGTGDHLTAVPWNASWDAEVQSEVADALDAAIPVTPTADSINERIKTMDDADLPGDVAAVKSDTAAILVDTAEIGAAGAGLTEAGGTGDHLTALATAAALATVDGNVDAILVDTGTTLQAELDGIQADTEDIQARLPAALSGAGNIIADVLAISGDTTAADRLEALMDGIIIGQVNDVGATTTVFAADGFTEATNDHLNGRLITFITGALTGQQTSITDYVGATQTITCVALTEAPANDDFFVVH